MLEFLVVLVVLAAAVWLVVEPLRRQGREEGVEPAASEGEREVIEAAKAAKYAEIRDAELDHRTGKLSDEDWRALDAQLRAEALELLRQEEALEDPAPPPDR